MGTLHTTLKFMVGHVLAGAVVILGTTLVTLVCYVAGLATAKHGIDSPVAVLPEFLGLMFMAVVFAVVLSTASFLISTCLVWIRSKSAFPRWLAPFIVALVAFLGSLLQSSMPFTAMVTGLAFLYFGAYWTVLTSSGAVLDWIRRKMSVPKTA